MHKVNLDLLMNFSEFIVAGNEEFVDTVQGTLQIRDDVVPNTEVAQEAKVHRFCESEMLAEHRDD
jgi:hypothetical protein